MREFIDYCLMRIWGLITIGIGVYIVYYRVEYGIMLSVRLLIPIIIVAIFCAVVYHYAHKRFVDKYHVKE